MNARPRPENSTAREPEPALRRPVRPADPARSRQAQSAHSAVPGPSGTGSSDPGPGPGPGIPPPAGRPEEGGETGGAGSSRAPQPDPGPDSTDLLEHPDVSLAADAAAAECLLRCWVRETGISRPPEGSLRLALPATGVALRVPVRYWSASGWHRFGAPVLDPAPPGSAPLDAVALAALLGREAAAGDRSGATLAQAAALTGRVADSVRHTETFLADRRVRPGPGPHTDRFLDSEQALLLGHPLHPAPKSREGLTGTAAHTFSPELRGSFRLHWMAVDRSVLAADSAWTEGGRPVPAEALTARLAGGELRLPPGTAPLPLHPWQAADLRLRPEVRELLEAGLLHDLGELGEPWHPTSSIRTVHRPGAPAMLKLSLGLSITNSRRENLRKELHRGAEVHRLLETGLGAQWRAAFPDGAGADIVRDPAWLAVDDARGRPVAGLDVLLRHNPFSPGEDVACVASLTAPRPWPGSPGRALRSRLADAVTSLAARTGRSVPAVAAEWFLRYLRSVVAPVLWLDAEAGIALEAHQQNTLVMLDADGWPQGGRYRDNQGFYFRASRRDALLGRLPGIGETSETFVADEVADERFAYYLGVNNVLGLIGAFGSQGLAGEALLLAAFRSFLAERAVPADGAAASPVAARLLQEPTLRSKANLLTRLRGMDELVGPVDGQSVYVTLANPLAPPAGLPGEPAAAPPAELRGSTPVW